MSRALREAPPYVSQTGLLHTLRDDLPRLNRSARKIAEVVLDNPALAASETLTELGERARVSESSIVRFIRQCGFKRFQEFKVALAFDAAQEASFTSTQRFQDADTLLPRLLVQAQRTLEQTADGLGEAVLTRIADHLLHADRILLFGAGTSGVIALEFNFKLLRLGLPVTTWHDFHMASMQAALLTGRSVAVVISRSGTTIDTLHVLDLARTQGATTVVITSKPKSTAAQRASYVLLAVGAESPLEGGTLASEISALFLLNALQAVLLDRLPDARDRLLRTARAVSDKRE